MEFGNQFPGSTIFWLTIGKIHQLREQQASSLENEDDNSVAMRTEVIMDVNLKWHAKGA